jgi:hypothetical protein
MCSTVVENAIREVIDEKVLNEELFTAFDVTKVVRQNVSEQVYHSEVRNVVQRAWVGDADRMIGYDRELCTLNVADKPQAFVYLPQDKTVEDYPLVDSDDVVDSNDIVDNVASDEDVFSVEGAGRLNIPKKILDKVSPNPVSGSYDFMVNGNLVCHRKNANGAIRISVKTFGLTGDKCRVEIDKSNDTISISSL